MWVGPNNEWTEALARAAAPPSMQPKGQAGQGKQAKSASVSRLLMLAFPQGKYGPLWNIPEVSHEDSAFDRIMRR